MIAEVSKAIAKIGHRRLGILGTRTVMETRFYGGVRDAMIIPPDDSDLDNVHHAYVTMAASGIATDTQRDIFVTAGRKMIEAGAEAIMLGGTDLALVFREGYATFPIVDCAAIHTDAIAKEAL